MGEQCVPTTMKRCGSVVSYYVDELNDGWNKLRSLIII